VFKGFSNRRKFMTFYLVVVSGDPKHATPTVLETELIFTSEAEANRRADQLMSDYGYAVAILEAKPCDVDNSQDLTRMLLASIKEKSEIRCQI
jgi:hypothetical protein